MSLQYGFRRRIDNNYYINERKERFLSKLALITFESQLPPTLVAVALLAIYTANYNSFIVVPFIWVRPKLYGISLLYTLNRKESMGQSPTGSGTSYTPSSNGNIHFSDGTTRAAQVAQTIDTAHNGVIPLKTEHDFASSQGAAVPIDIEMTGSCGSSPDTGVRTSEETLTAARLRPVA
ncbi:hypothetical protein RhiJN_20544 [Ceratobasidium sp. AG-Ba]|nr:hypothetical protein RhiJN_20544 [Ceratobasidium sp. AG-Ba]